mmetsp:Transcript_29531/g.81168  ORF Transcript_29531/g.81168 Transcript_29531/m.81168 type:complete len:602 (+) Transcript_29531:193-1998(+)
MENQLGSSTDGDGQLVILVPPVVPGAETQVVGVVEPKDEQSQQASPPTQQFLLYSSMTYFGAVLVVFLVACAVNNKNNNSHKNHHHPHHSLFLDAALAVSLVALHLVQCHDTLTQLTCAATALGVTLLASLLTTSTTTTASGALHGSDNKASSASVSAANTTTTTTAPSPTHPHNRPSFWNAADALYQLGCCYETGSQRTGVEQSWEQAVHYYRQAAALGHANAQYKLATCWANGQGVAALTLESTPTMAADTKEDCTTTTTSTSVEDTAVEVAKNTIIIQPTPHDIYQKGVNHETQHHWNDAVQCYRQAANLGHADAQYKLAICLANGYGVEAIKNHPGTAAAALQPATPPTLDEIYQKGVHHETEQNWNDAVKSYRHAANLGHADAQYKLAICLAHGYGAQAFKEECASSTEVAAAPPRATPPPAAPPTTEEIYQEGVNHESNQNWNDAVKCYRQAANQGHADAQYKLAICLVNGHGVEAIKRESYPSTATTTTPSRMTPTSPKPATPPTSTTTPDEIYQIGVDYEAEQNWDKAVKCYRQAANQGHADAQYKLAICLAHGHGVQGLKSHSNGVSPTTAAKIGRKIKDMTMAQYKAVQVG